jgi:hypothetical protein
MAIPRATSPMVRGVIGYSLVFRTWTRSSRSIRRRTTSAALVLAVMRMHKGFLAELASFPEFLRRGGFIPAQMTKHISEALRDLLAAMEAKGYDDPRQCLNEMVFNEFFAN